MRGRLPDRGPDIWGLGDQRRDEDGENRVAGVALGKHLDDAPVVIAGRGRDHVDRVAEGGGCREEFAELRLDLRREFRHVDSIGMAGVGAHDARAPGVRHDRDAGPARNRLFGEQRRHVEQLVQRIGADHARLLEQRVNGDVGRGEERPGVGRGRARPGRRAAALDRQDRLLAGDPGGDAGELARVPERLEVEQGDVGAGVLLPVLQEVIA